VEYRFYSRPTMNDLFPEAPDMTESPLAAPPAYLSLMQSVSHELRSTFGVISGLHSLLPLASGEAEREDMFNRLHNNTEYAVQLFTDLEDYCAMETGPMRVEPTSFRLAGAFENVRKKMRTMLQRRNTTVLLSGDSELLVTCDEEKIRRVLKNIIFHLACMVRTQAIEIGWEKHATTWTITIAYSGDALPGWLFMPGEEPGEQNMGRNISLLMVHRLMSLLNGEIYGGTDDGRQWISLQFPQ